MLIGGRVRERSDKIIAFVKCFCRIDYRNCMKQFALCVTTKQSAYNFSAPPPGRAGKKMFRSLRSRTCPPLTFL